MARLPDLANLDYVRRIDRVIDHVDAHPGEPLSLDEAAAIACFSPFHFHRIFKALVGESLLSFVKRRRLERALALRARRPGLSLTDVALATGFGSSSDFSRSFRKHFGVAPSGLDVEALRASGRARLRAQPAAARLPTLEPADAVAVTLRAAPARRVAYLRVWRPFEPGKVAAAAARLVVWARSRGLEHGRWLGFMWDDPEVVPLERCRYDVGVELPARASGDGADGEVGVVEFAAVTLAEVRVAGPIEDELRALDGLYRGWLPTSGLVPADQPCFEAWSGLPFAHGDRHFELTVQLPVVAAGPP